MSDVPIPGICFEIVADGATLGSFSDCSGLTAEVTTEDYREGGVNHFVYKLPKHVTSPSLVLKRGVTASTDLWKWVTSFADSTKIQTKTVEVRLNGPDGKTVRAWVATNAYPIKYEGPTLNASRSEVAMETLELAHQGLSAGS